MLEFKFHKEPSVLISTLSVTALKHKSKLYSPSQDLFAICGRSQREHTEPPLIWTTKHNSAHTHRLDTAVRAQLLIYNHTLSTLFIFLVWDNIKAL